MEMFIGWVGFSILAGWIANSKGRSGFGYFVLSMVLSPLIGLLAVFGVPARAAPPSLTVPPPNDGIRVTCPACAEWVLPAAKRCKHCGVVLTTPSDESTMASLGISHDGQQYVFGAYRYDRLDDAVAYAKKTRT